jgi:hypothetical protein
MCLLQRKQNISPVAKGDVNQQIIGVEIVTNGALTLYSATSISFNTAGTGGTVTNQIQNAKLYFTGTSPVFSCVTQVGSTVTTQWRICHYTNCRGQERFLTEPIIFWLSYDIKSTACARCKWTHNVTRLRWVGRPILQR